MWVWCNQRSIIKLHLHCCSRCVFFLPGVMSGCRMQTKSEVSGQGSRKTDHVGRQSDQNGMTAENKGTQWAHRGGTECFQFVVSAFQPSSRPSSIPRRCSPEHTHTNTLYFLCLLWFSKTAIYPIKNKTKESSNALNNLKVSVHSISNTAQ